MTQDILDFDLPPGSYSKAWNSKGEIIYDPEKETTFEEQWFDEFERDRWENAVNNAYWKLKNV